MLFVFLFFLLLSFFLKLMVGKQRTCALPPPPTDDQYGSYIHFVWKLCFSWLYWLPLITSLHSTAGPSQNEPLDFSRDVSLSFHNNCNESPWTLSCFCEPHCVASLWPATKQQTLIKEIEMFLAFLYVLQNLVCFKERDVLSLRLGPDGVYQKLFVRMHK